MGEGWHASASELARAVQERRGWSDCALVAHLLVLVRLGRVGPPVPDEREVLAVRAAHPGDGAATVAAVAERLPAFSGYFASLGLDGLLHDQPDLAEAEVDAVLATPGHVPERVERVVRAQRAGRAVPSTRPRPRPRSSRTERRRAIVIAAGSLVAMVAAALLWTLLTGW